MLKNLCIAVLILLSISLPALSIKGRVIDQENNPLESVTIICAGRYHKTNEDGRFMINNCSDNSTLKFHKLGYRDVEISAGMVTSVVVLEREAIEISGIRVESSSDISSQISSRNKKIINVDDKVFDRSLSELLEKELNVTIGGTSLTGEEQKITVPGFEPRHTAILVDGIPINKPGEAVDLSTIPIDIIETIEVSDMASEGNGGMALTVNLITKKGADNNQLIEITAIQKFGSFGLKKSGVSLGMNRNNWDFWIYAANSYAKNNFTYEPRDYWESPDSLRERKNNEKNINDVNCNLGINICNFNLRYRLIYQNFMKKLPGPTSNPELYEDSRLTGDTARHYFNIEKSLEYMDIFSNLYYFREDTKYDNTRIDEPWSNFTNYYTLNRHRYRKTGEMLGIISEQDWYNLEINQRLEQEEFAYKEITDPEDSIPKVTRNNFQLALNATLNQDLGLFKFSQFGSFSWMNIDGKDDYSSWTAGAEVGFENTIEVVTGFQFQKEISLPGFYDLYWMGDAQTLGNPDLESEKSEAWKIYTNLTSGGTEVRIHYRQADVTNKIIWFPDFNHIWKPANLSGADIRSWGIDIHLNLLPILNIDMSYSDTEALDRTYTSGGQESAFWGNQLIYTPEINALVGIDMAIGDVDFALNYRYVGEQWASRDQISDSKRLDYYDCIDGDIKYNTAWGFLLIQPAVSINNILDRHYEIYEYMPQPGFNYEFSLKIKYNGGK